MMRAVLLALALLVAPPAMAEMNRDCQAIWDSAVARIKGATLTGRYSGTDGDWCVFKELRLATQSHDPDFAADSLRLRGTAPAWFLLGQGSAQSGLDVEIKVEGLRFFAKTGMANFDYLFQLQAASNRTAVDLALTWDARTKEVVLTRLNADFPGDNALSATARIGNVDLSSQGAMQMSATGFALRHATLDITSNGLFESTLLLPLGMILLPADGDMVAAAEALRMKVLGAIQQLPEQSFPPSTKAAVSQLVIDMPNPAGTLALRFDAPDGFGPARMTPFVLHGLPKSVADLAPVFRGVRLDATWTPTPAP